MTFGLLEECTYGKKIVKLKALCLASTKGVLFLSVLETITLKNNNNLGISQPYV